MFNLVGDLMFARATHRSPYETISSTWRRTLGTFESGGRFEWDLEIPANTTATVHVSMHSQWMVKESGQPLGLARGVKLMHSAGARFVLQLGSGKYKLSSE